MGADWLNWFFVDCVIETICVSTNQTTPFGSGKLCLEEEAKEELELEREQPAVHEEGTR